MNSLLIKGLTCFSLVSSPVFAELKALDDAQMGQVLGQAGLTIELETRVSIGEIAYKDEGYLLIQDFTLGGIGGTNLDNLLINIDIAGDSETLNYGFSRMAEYANAGLVDASNPDVADAVSKYNQGGGQYGKVLNDGDMIIHMDSIDDNVVAGNTSDQNIAAYTSATDFEMTIGNIYNTASTYNVGDMVPSGTSYFSDISIQGYLGPVDMVIRNIPYSRFTSW